MNPARLRAKKDPTLTNLEAKYKGVRMPNLGLSESDASDLISYLATRTAQMNELRAQPRSSISTPPKAGLITSTNNPEGRSGCRAPERRTATSLRCGG